MRAPGERGRTRPCTPIFADVTTMQGIALLCQGSLQGDRQSAQRMLAKLSSPLPASPNRPGYGCPLWFLLLSKQ